MQFTAVPWMRDHLHAADGRDRRHDRDRSGQAALRGAVRGSASSSPAAPTGSLIDLVSTPEQKAGHRPDHRGDEPARGSCRRGDGRCRPGGDPDASRRSGEGSPQRRKGVGTLDRLLRRLLGLDQKMAQYRDGARVRALDRRRGRDGRVQRRLGRAGEPARQGGDPRPCGLAPARPRLMALDPALAAVRLAVRRVLADAALATVLVACSGGADSLALLAATVFEGRTRAAPGDRGHRRPRPAGRLRRARRSGSSRRWRRSVPTRRGRRSG